MILSLAGDGPLGRALHAKLAAMGQELRVASASENDLFGRACGCRAIVYMPAPRLLDGRLRPEPSVERTRGVLGATNAPGVQLLVVALPPGYEQEEIAVRKSGCPYVIVRTPPLLEEVADDPAVQERCSVWLPRGHRVAVATAGRVADEILRVVADDSVQGATIDAPSETIDAAEVLRRAAAMGGRASVRTVPPLLNRAVDHVGRLLRIPQPPIVHLYGRLASG